MGESVANRNFYLPMNRRQMFRRFVSGFGMLGLAGPLTEVLLAGSLTEAAASANPLGVKPPPSSAKAKRVIFLFMSGGPSLVDTFDPKPRLATDDVMFSGHEQKLPP